MVNRQKEQGEGNTGKTEYPAWVLASAPIAVRANHAAGDQNAVAAPYRRNVERKKTKGNNGFCGVSWAQVKMIVHSGLARHVS